MMAVGSQVGLYVERKRAADELERFFDLSLDLLCVASLDGYFLRLNPAWDRVLGFEDAELLRHALHGLRASRRSRRHDRRDVAR